MMSISMKGKGCSFIDPNSKAANETGKLDKLGSEN